MHPERFPRHAIGAEMTETPLSPVAWNSVNRSCFSLKDDDDKQLRHTEFSSWQVPKASVRHLLGCVQFNGFIVVRVAELSAS